MPRFAAMTAPPLGSAMMPVEIETRSGPSDVLTMRTKFPDSSKIWYARWPRSLTTAVPSRKTAYPAGLIELTGPFARRTEFAHEIAGGVEHQDAQTLPEDSFPQPVKDVQVAAGVKAHLAHRAEHLPGLPVEHADPEDLLEAGVEAPVPAGELDHLLGHKGERRGEGGCKKCRGDCAEANGMHGCRSLAKVMNYQRFRRHYQSVRLSGTSRTR